MRISAWATGLAVAVFQVGATWLAAMGDRQPLRHPLDAFAVFLLLAGPLALMGRDRWPVAAVAVAVVSTDLYLAMGYPYGPVFLSVVVAVFSAIRRGRRYPTYAWVAAGVVALVAAYRLSPRVVETHGSLHFLFIVGWTGVLVAVSEIARIQAMRAEERKRVEEEEAERKAADQRLELAQELHDVLAHHISLINVQASVALHLLDEQPDRARPALAAIKEASKESLAELRTALDLLRRGEPPRKPAPSIEDIEELISGVEASGLRVTLEREGEPGALPAAVGQAAYRIVQEALTNVTRHAWARTARVRLRFEDGVDVEVVDDGIGGTVEEGTGLSGMRRRAESLGARSKPADPRESDSGCGRTSREDRRVIRILIADDQALVRAGFRALLDAQPDMTVVADVADGHEALRVARRERPDVVLMDIRCLMDGLQATQRITADESLADTKVVILTTFDLDEYVFEAIRRRRVLGQRHRPRRAAAGGAHRRRRRGVAPPGVTRR